MPALYPALARATAIALLLLASCRGTPESPGPARSPSKLAPPPLAALRRTFEAQHYEAQLRQPAEPAAPPGRDWRWTPQWEQASQTTLADSACYTYVPLQAQRPTRPSVLTLVGLRRYLLLKHTRRGLRSYLLSYLYPEPKPGEAGPESPGFFARFTGSVLLRELATGRTGLGVYQRGQRQPLAPLADKAAATGTGQRVQACYPAQVCTWSSACSNPGNGTVTVYGTTTWGFGGCATPSSAGGCGNTSWTCTGSSSQLFCDPADPDDPNDPGPGPGNPNNPGGPGTGNPPTQTPDPHSPCGQLATLSAQAGFHLANTTMMGMSQGSVERGYVFRNGGQSSADFAPFLNGTSNEVDWPRVAGWQYDGTMHTHPGGLSVFSISDIATLYDIANAGYMRDPATFTLLVYTSYGQDYAIKITDYNQFLNFAPKIADEYSIAFFEKKYITSSPPIYPFVHSSSSLNEQSLLRILRDFNTGLVLLKHDRASNSWQPRTLDATNTPVSTPCL